MRLRKRTPESQIQEIVRCLLQISRPDIDTPVIVSTREGNRCCSVGRLLEREGAWVSAIMDVALEGTLPVTLFLSEGVYVGEVTGCVAQGDEFTIELGLIMSRGLPDGLARKAQAFAAISS